MRQGAFLLQDHNLSIADITVQLGYSNPRHFTKLFSRCYGISPREMRKSLSGDLARERDREERRTRELSTLLRDGWLPLLECDFARTEALDPHFRMYQYYDEADEQLLPRPAIGGHRAESAAPAAVYQLTLAANALGSSHQ